MKVDREHPHIYEINLMTWLHGMGLSRGRRVSLAEVSLEAWEDIKSLGMDMVWLMGIWRRSAYSVARAMGERGILEEYRNILGGLKPGDIAGSPYSVQDYKPDPRFGSPEELAALKTTLQDLGLLLVLDLVPNHTACDHPWVRQDPDLYLQGRQVNMECEAGFFRAKTRAGELCLAHGKDPYFAPWTDTAQLDYARPSTARSMALESVRLLPFCHGLRCDMAMLILKDVFRQTWGQREGFSEASGEPWETIMGDLRAAAPDFLMLAEAYWDKETELLSLGFDYVYDKTFYDLLRGRDAAGLRHHLAEPYAARRVRFLENHDEPRAMTTFGAQMIRCAMVVHGTLPGMRLWHHGQFEGSRTRVPVQLARAPEEPPDPDLNAFSRRLLREIDHPVFHRGLWRPAVTRGWPDNLTHENLLAWTWEADRERRLVVANITGAPAQGRVAWPEHWIGSGENLVLQDPLNGVEYVRTCSDLSAAGLHVELGAGDFHFLRVQEG